jgi:hypothetical protein
VAVSETLALDDALAGQLDRRLDAVVVNRLFPPRFSSNEAERLGSVPEDPAVRSAKWFYGRAQAQRTQLRRLGRGMARGPRRAKLPFIFTDRFRRADVERLADQLEQALADQLEGALTGQLERALP